MADTDPPLPDAITSFLETHQMAPVTFGRLALRDPHFVRDVRSGRRLWPETEQKVRDFMARYEPAQSEVAA